MMLSIAMRIQAERERILPIVGCMEAKFSSLPSSVIQSTISSSQSRNPYSTLIVRPAPSLAVKSIIRSVLDMILVIVMELFLIAFSITWNAVFFMLNSFCCFLIRYSSEGKKSLHNHINHAIFGTCFNLHIDIMLLCDFLDFGDN